MIGVAVGAVLLVAAAVLAYLHYSFNVAPFRGQSFDRTAWIEAMHCGGDLTPMQCNRKRMSCQRGPMVRDLVVRVLPPGSSRQEVEQALGAGSRASQPGAPCLHYGLGACAGMELHWLDACFGGDGTLKTLRVVSD